MERTRAVILAAGKGSRLQSEKDDIPKALRKVGNKTLIEHVLDGISFVKPEDITIVIGVLGEKIQAYLDTYFQFSNKNMDIKLKYIQLVPVNLSQMLNKEMLI